MKKLLVIGSNGMLGLAVSEYFKRNNYHVENLTRAEFNIAEDNIEKLETIVKNVDFVVNCTGIVKVRINEVKIEDVLKVNSVFPVNLAKLCNAHEKMCFHITTDCAFSGKREMYDETDYFDAQDIYGLSKCAGEPSNCMVLRISIIGEEKGNSRGLLEWFRSQKGKSVNGYVNHSWNGLTTVYLAEVIENIIDQNLYSHSTFHLFSDRVVSKFELLTMINEIYDLKIKINRFETSESCNRSLSSKKTLCNKVVNKPLSLQIEEMKDFFS